MLRRLVPDLFVLALIASVLLATFLPVQGEAARYFGWLATAAIVLLFFFLGAKLTRESIVSGLRNWRLQLAILGSTFVMFPLLCLGINLAVPGLLAAPIWLGILYVGALSSTVQSSIAFTSIARGNVAAAVAAASASQLIGVLLTPPLVGLLAGVHGGSVPLSGVGPILLQILVPFVVGHLLRPWIGGWVDRHKPLISITDRGTILLAIYGAFSSAVVEGLWHQVPPRDLLILILVCLVILAVALLFTRSLARLMRLERPDEIALVFCGTKKSLVQGVPMARALFAGPHLGLILLPIMIFHQVQLMACAAIARRYAKDDGDVHG